MAREPRPVAMDAEHKKQFESVIKEVETQKQRMEKVYVLCVSIVVASL